MDKYTITDEIAELKRENNTRIRVYPKWVQEGRISKEEAKKRLLIMSNVINRLEKIQAQIQGEQLKIV